MSWMRGRIMEAVEYPAPSPAVVGPLRSHRPFCEGQNRQMVALCTSNMLSKEVLALCVPGASFVLTVVLEPW